MSSRSENGTTMFLDVVFNMAGVFLCLTMLAIPFINEKATDGEPGDVPPGNIQILATWPEGDTDVDLWVFGPGELRPVGYSNANGLVWNLLRDDLGLQPDATSINMENTFARGILPGRLTINAHCYRCPQLPVPVNIEVRANKDGAAGGKSGSSTILVTTKVMLTRQGEEKTAIDFKMNAAAEIDDASMNNIFQPLRNAAK